MLVVLSALDTPTVLEPGAGSEVRNKLSGDKNFDTPKGPRKNVDTPTGPGIAYKVLKKGDHRR